jgi:nicotinate-nucleotide adenylyltransferase
MRKQIGLFFGTFNPIHLGHVIIGGYMLEYASIDELWFVVTPHNPHKQKSSLLNDYTRLELVRLAIGENHRMRVSDVEFGLSQPSYTSSTLAHLHEKYPDYDFALIMGEDNVQNLHKWHNYEYVLNEHRILVYPRMSDTGTARISHPNVEYTSAPVIELSSSFIRSAIKEGRNVDYMMPPAVAEYIQKSNLYC